MSWARKRSWIDNNAYTYFLAVGSPGNLKAPENNCRAIEAPVSMDVIEERDGYVLISLSCRVLRTVLRNFFLTPENDMSVFPSTVPHFEGMGYAHICRLT